MEVHREQLALDQVGLRRLAQADGDVGLAHGEVEFFVGQDQLTLDLRIEVQKFVRARGGSQCDADADRGGDLERRRAAARGCR